MQFNIIGILDWCVEKLVPYVFTKLDTFMITEHVSVLGFSVAVTILIIAIGAIVLRV